MNKKLQKIADDKGVCCVYQLFRTTAHWQVKKLARDLSVTTRCVRQNRHNIRSGKLQCKNYPDCQRSVSTETSSGGTLKSF